MANFANLHPNKIDPITFETFEAVDQTIEEINSGLGIEPNSDFYAEGRMSRSSHKVVPTRHGNTDGLKIISIVLLTKDEKVTIIGRNDCETSDDELVTAAALRKWTKAGGITGEIPDLSNASLRAIHEGVLIKHADTFKRRRSNPTFLATR